MCQVHFKTTTHLTIGPYSSDTADKAHDLKFQTKPVVACQNHKCNKAPVTQSRFTTIHPDLSQMVKSGCIGMRQDGKKENPASKRCLTMLLQCLHDSSTYPLRLMKAALYRSRLIPHRVGAP